MSPNETRDAKLAPAAETGSQQPVRRCVLTGERSESPHLVRLALSPDGIVAPDVRAKAPGRGAWIGVDRPALEQAIAKGKLKGVLTRAFKTTQVECPADLPEKIESALTQGLLDRLGLEARGGTLLTGSDRIAEAARRGKVAMLLHASDAAADGNGKLDQAWRVGSDAEGSGKVGQVLPVDRTSLSVALGRDNVVHIALTDHRAAARVDQFLGRLVHFRGAGAHVAPETKT